MNNLRASRVASKKAKKRSRRIKNRELGDWQYISPIYGSFNRIRGV